MPKQVSNRNHPELREGEDFYCNAVEAMLHHEPLCKFKTVRVGEQAYDTYGYPITHLKPVFVSTEEVQFLIEQIDKNHPDAVQLTILESDILLKILYGEHN